MGFKDFFKDKPALPTPNELPERVIGSIIHINKKGFGFISTPAISFERIYFYWTALTQDTLRFGDLKNRMQVEFTPKKYDKGWRAIEIKVIE